MNRCFISKLDSILNNPDLPNIETGTSTTLTITDAECNGLYLYKDGTVSSDIHGTYHTTDFIPISATTKISGNGVFSTAADFAGVVVYASDKETVIGYFGSSSSYVLAETSLASYTNGSYIRVMFTTSVHEKSLTISEPFY